MLQISVFGLGYVGCVSATCLAKNGHRLIGIDKNEDKVNLINAGRSPIVEPGLSTQLVKVTSNGNLRVTTSCEDAVKNSDIALICVGTPSGLYGQLDTTSLMRVGEEIGRSLKGRKRPFTVVLRSTVLPGTMDSVLAPAMLKGAEGSFSCEVNLAMNPEFMREGSALQDFASPPLTLVGCENPETASLLRTMYSEVDAPFIHTSITTAEMVKYASNIYHALKVCFSNEMGELCNMFNADPQEVMRLFRMDRKLNVSEAYLRPGFAFGGSCLPKDIRAMLYAASHSDVNLPLLNSIIPSNDWQVKQAVDKILATGKRNVGVVGLAFKPGTDDLRESPMVTLVETLIGKGLQVRILDRNVSITRLIGANRRYIEEEIPHISTLMCNETAELLKDAEVIVIGGNNLEATDVLDNIRPGQKVVDLTRGAVRYHQRNRETEEA